MSEALENVFIAEVETSRRNERPAQREWLLCSGGSRYHLPQEATFFTVGCTCIMPARGITLCFIQEYSKGQTSMPQEVSISAILTVSTFSKLMAP